jgi:hypothetical protein
MNYDTITNTILKSDSLENKGELLTPLMDFAQKVLLYENEAISEQDSVNAVPSPPDEIKDFCVDNLVAKVARCCRESKVGKKLPTAFYVHVSALQHSTQSSESTKIVPDALSKILMKQL